MNRHTLWRRLALALILAGTCAGALAGTVVIYAAADRGVVEPLIADFRQTRPDVKVEYHELSTTELHERFLKETGANSQADVVWSSAMDLQMKLVNDGHAMPHRSVETYALPLWARWKDEAFGITFEPVCFAYNSHLLAPELVPQTHAELARLLRDRPELFRDRLATYDPHRSGLGYLLHTQDLEANPVVFWDLIRQMAQAGLATEPTTGQMLDRIAAGRAVLGYNVLCSYAWARESTGSRIATVMPRDYTLVMSRIAFISRYAPHPEEAKAWLDYVLSLRGQGMLNLIGLHPVRGNVEGGATAASLRMLLGNAFRPIALSTGLLTYIDRSKTELFMRQWDAALQSAQAVPPVQEPPGARPAVRMQNPPR